MASRTICLFDVDGTLTQPRQVLYFLQLFIYPYSVTISVTEYPSVIHISH